jgi:hypothetical protein
MALIYERWGSGWRVMHDITLKLFIFSQINFSVNIPPIYLSVFELSTLCFVRFFLTFCLVQ